MKPLALAALGVLLAGPALARPLRVGDDALSLDGVLLAQAPTEVPPPPPAPPPPTTMAPPAAYPPAAYPQPVYQQPVYQPAPTYYQPMPMRAPHFVAQPRWGLFVAGLSLWGLSYVLDISFTYALGHSPAGEAWIPLVGPLVQMNDGVSSQPNNPSANGYYDEGTEVVAKVMLVWDFIGQLAGLTMAVLGISLWHNVAVYSDASDLPPKKQPKIRFAITPGPSGHGNGFALIF